jgi:hypothetical protein
MSRYEIQKEIFRLTMNLYPHYQHEEVYKYLQNLWKREDKAFIKYLDTLRGITA